MFVVAGHQFEIDPERVRLVAWIGPEELEGEGFASWTISVGAIPRRIDFPQLGDDAPGQLSPAIEFKTRFGVRDWRALVGNERVLEDEEHALWMLESQWEGLVHCRLRFQGADDGLIGIEIEGVGLHESWPELFGEEVPFKITASLRFVGVSMFAPVDEPDPVAFALPRLRYVLPDSRFGPPQVKKVDFDGKYFGSDMLFPPELD